MRLFPTTASCFALALCAAFAFADDVVLKNGRKFSGTIVKDDAAGVTIELHGGTMTFSRATIETVRKSPAPAAPAAPTATPPVPSAPPKSAEAPPPQPEGRRSSVQKPVRAANGEKTPRMKWSEDLLVLLEKIRLAPWTLEEPSRATESGRDPYKVVRADGVAELSERQPVDGTGIEAFYERRDLDDGKRIELIDGMRQMYWYRRYWNPTQRRWMKEPAELQDFQSDQHTAGKVAESACAGDDAYRAVAARARELTKALSADRSSPADQQRAELRKACAASACAESLVDLLERHFQLSVEIELATTSAEKISIARKRRETLRELVAAFVN